LILPFIFFDRASTREGLDTDDAPGDNQKSNRSKMPKHDFFSVSVFYVSDQDFHEAIYGAGKCQKRIIA
jgi:hypothetical protein